MEVEVIANMETYEGAAGVHHCFFITVNILPQWRNEPHSHPRYLTGNIECIVACEKREFRRRRRRGSREQEKPGAIVNGARA